MAQSNFTLGAVDIIARHGGAKIADVATGTRSVSLTQSSIVRIHGTQALVSSYERQGNDLIVHMKDGTTVRYQSFFELDADGKHSELVFDDGNGAIQHAIFPATAATTEPMLITPQFESLSDVSPLLITDHDLSNGAIAAILAGLALGAGVAIATGTGKNDHNNDEPSVTPEQPTLTVGKLGQDNVLNASEVKIAQLLSGLTTGVAAGATITLTLNGKSYTTTVGADGKWSFDFSSAALSGLKDGNYQLTVKVTNQDGVSVEKTISVLVDTTPPALTVNKLTGDDQLTGAELKAAQALSGTGEAGLTITITLNGKTYTTTVGSNGKWSLQLPAADLALLKNGNYELIVTSVDKVGNQTTVDHQISVDTTVVNPTPQITINALTGDNVINANEAKSTQTLSGHTQNVEAGQTVTITLNGKTYSAVVQGDGSWSLSLPAADLAALANGSTTLNATVTDKAGQSANAHENITVDLAAPVLTVNKLAGDDVLNAAEAQTPQTLSGTSNPGQAIVVTLNGKTYTTVTGGDGKWSLVLPGADLQALAQGDNTLTVTATDAAGNSTTVTEHLQVDTVPPVLTLDKFTGDDVVTADEQKSAQNITGTASVSEAGLVVSVSFNGKTYTGIVGADGKWSISVPAADMAALTNGSYEMIATLSDQAGNTTTTAPQLITVDNQLSAINIGIVSSDDKLNAVEAGLPLAISGTTANVATGATVTVTLNGKTYTALVLADGSWTLQVPSADLQLLAEGSNTISASVTGNDGSTVTTTHNLDVYTHNLPAVTLDTPFGDGILNGAEAGQTQTLTGTTGITSPGQTITITLGGKTYTGTVDGSGHWSVTIPAADLQALPDGTPALTVTVTDAAGNSNTLNTTVTVDETAPSLIINTIAGDDILNAAEVLVAQTVSGTASVADAGRTVTLTLNGKTYTAVVQADGTWSASLPAADLAALADGSHNLVATLTDAAGNSTSVTHGVSVDADPANLPTLSINVFAGNDIIDGAEVKTAQTLSGTSTHVQAGQTVTITLNGKTYTATVLADGSWSTSVPAADLALLANGQTTITATVSDSAGNPASASHDVTVDTSLSGLSIAVIAGDDKLSLAESQSPLVISGSSANLAVRTTVTVTLNGKTYTGTTLADGSWSVTVPAADLALLADGTASVTVNAVDQAGNPVSDSHNLGVFINGLPDVTLNTPFGDGILNGAEAGQPQTLTGTTGITSPGQTITITLGGKTYTGTVDGSGHWSVTIPAADLQALPDGTPALTVTVTDAAGNSNTLNTTVTVDETAPTLTINTIAGDDILNAAEVLVAQTVSGTASIADAGRTVTLTLNGKTYTAVVQADGTWSASLPAADLAALADGSHNLVATLTDAAGNSTSVTHGVSVDADPANLPTLSINVFAGNDIIDGAEVKTAQTLSGTTTHVQAGQTVTITLNGKTYTATVLADGSWSTSVPAADLALLANGQTTITATVSDSAGNPASANHDVTVDTDLSGLSIAVIAGDDKLSLAESQLPLAISGSSANLAVGTTVTVTLNGKTYTGTTLADGSWSVTVPAADLALLGDGTTTVTVTAVDQAGNPVNDSHNLGVFTHSLPEATLNTPFGDGILNGAEAGQSQTLTGTTGITTPGQTVTVTLGGKTYTGTVDANGNWSVTLPSADLQALPDGTPALTVTVTDAAGNTNTLNTTVTVDETAPTLTVGLIAGDDVLNAAEVLVAQTVSGTASIGDAGRTVTLTLNGKTYTAVVQPDGSWSTSLPAADLAALADGSHNLVATLTDAAGNSTSITHSINVDANPINLPTVSIGVFAGNDIVDGAEVKTAQTLSGTTTHVEAGQTVTITLNGKTYTATVLADGSWSTSVPAADLALLANGQTTITATVSDSAGNPASANHDVTVDTDLSGLSIAVIAGDDKLSLAESQLPLVISGSSANLATGATVTVTLNGKTYTGTTLADGSWSVTVPAADLALLADGTTTVTVSAVDQAGNPVNDSHDLGVFTHTLPEATLNTPFGDGILNGAEAGQPQTLTGATGITTPGQTVTVTLGGKTYTGTVDANGNWSATIPAADLQALPDGTPALTVTVTDAAGNTNTLNTTVTVDETAPTLTVGLVAGDDVLNAAEVLVAQTVSGTASIGDAGRTVTLTLNGKTYTAVVQPDGSWSTSLPAADLAALADGSHNLVATLTDAAGNSTSVTHSINVDANPANLPTVSIGVFAGNDIIDGAEVKTAQTLSGTTTHVEAGQTVTITLNGKTYTATVLADGSWSTSVPAADLALLANGQTTITATVSDSAGNPASANHDVTVDTDLSGLSIAVIAGDDKLSLAESQLPLAINGNSQNLAVGATVTVTLNGKTYTGTTLADGSWSISVPAADLALLADGTTTVTVTATDQAGNPVSGSHDLGVFIHSLPEATLNTPFGDGILNGTEAGQPQTITGSTGITTPGQTVTVTLGGKTYTGTVDGSGNWSVSVPSADLQALPDGTPTLSVTVTDAAGNSNTLNTTVTVDATAPTLTVNVVAGDDVLNAAEVLVAQTVSGTASVADAGRTVTLTLNGKTYTAVVQPDGSWSTSLPAADLQALSDGSHNLVATLTDTAGNSTSTTHVLGVDANPANLPTLSINVFAGNDIVDGAEVKTAQTLTGTTTHVEAGQTVTITLNGKTYTATVLADGSWSTSVPAADLALLANGQTTITATVNDTAGNPANASHDVTVDTNLSGLSISVIAGDDKLNLAESLQPLTISGDSANLPLGAIVTVTLNGKIYIGLTLPDGSWSVQVPAADLALLADGNATVSVSAVDQGGNLVSNSHNLGVFIHTLPDATLNTPFGDGILNGTEAGQPQTITGSTGITTPGQTVTVTLGGKTYTGTVDGSGNWSVTVPAADLQALPDGTPALSVVVTDAAGNSNTLNTTVTVDATAPTLTVGLIAGDDVLNAAEVLVAQTVSGTASIGDAGRTVTLTLNGKTYTAVVQPDGSWSTSLPAADLAALADGSHNLVATLTDTAGNSTSVTHSINVDANPANLPTVSIGVFAGNDIIDGAEVKTAQTLTGTTTHVEAGQTVTITLNGKTYTTTVLADGSWSTSVPAADLALLANGQTTITATVSDSAGNPASASHDVTVDTDLSGLSIAVIAGDDKLNLAESLLPLTINGGSANLATGATVTVTLNGKTYTGTTLADGSWSVTVPAADLALLADGTATLSVTAVDLAGNPVSGSHDLGVFIHSLPAATLNTPFGDGILNGAEAGQPQTITGSTGITTPGQTVTVTLGGKTYTGTVDGSGNWSVSVPSADLQALPDGTPALTVTVTDTAGNSNTLNTTVTVDATAPTLTVGLIAGDDVLNATEVLVAQSVSGTASIADAGRTVTLTLNGKTYTAVVQPDGSWNTSVPAADLQALSDGSHNLVAILTDAAGNSTSVTHSINVDANPANLPTVSIGVFAGNDIVDGAEVKTAQTLSGTSTHVEAGQIVTITLNGKTYTATVLADGSWSTSVPAADLALLANGQTTITATVSDSAGNPATANHDVTVDTDLSGLSIAVIAGDDKLNLAESQLPLAINGSSTNLAVGATVTVTLNGKTYTGTTLADGSWSVSVPAADLALLADGNSTVTVTATDLAGNPVSDSHNLGVFTHSLPEATLNTPFGDGILNGAEAGQPQTITGSTGITTPGQTVTVTLGGKTYTGTVDGSGNWSATIPAADLQALPDGTPALSVVVTDTAGNSNTLNTTVTVDATAPTLTVGLIAGDDVLNAAEVLVAQSVSGTASVADAGRTVTLTLNGKTYTAVVQPDGSWNTSLPAADLQALTDGSHDLVATLTDAAGNSTSVTHSLNIDANPANLPTLSIGAFAGDDIVNGAEALVTQALSGTTTNVEVGQTVTLTLNGKTYFATVQLGGGWSVNVPAADMALLANGQATITASVSDQAGNPATSSHTISVDTAVESIAINLIAGDDLLNLTEASQPLTISGTTVNVNAGQTVTVTLNGKTYTGVVLANGSWSVSVNSADLLALQDGLTTVTASVSNPGVDPVSDSHSLDVHIHTLPEPTINLPFGDGFLNQAEAATAQLLSGSTGIPGAGQSVIVTLGGKTYTATVDGSGNWSVSIPSADLQNLPAGSNTISVSATDSAGNSVPGSTTAQVDLVPPTLAVKPFAGDDKVNALESLSDQVVSGTASIGDAGRTVTVTLNGKSYTGVVANDGTWSATIPSADLQAMGDGSYPLTTTLSDAAGNSTTVTHTVTIDANPLDLPTLSINVFAGNDIIDGAEVKTSQTLSGTTTHVEAGQLVTITLNGKTYTATVQADGTWSTSVSAADLGQLAQGNSTISVTVSDTSGNPASATHNVVVNTALSGIAIDVIAGDDKLNLAESLLPLAINGSSLNLATGASVTVTLNGKTYTGTTLADGSWSVLVPPADLALLADGNINLSVSAVDQAGNPVSSSHTLGVFIHNLPDATLNTPFGDGILNGTEAGQPQTITGSTGITTPGQTVTVTLGDKTYTGTVDGSGNWSVTVPVGDLQALPDGTPVLNVVVTDPAGNSNTLNSTVVVDKVAPTLTVSVIAGDDVLNSAEVLLNQTVSGTASIGDAGRTVTLTLNGKTYTAVVQPDGSWSTSLPTADLTALSDGSYNLVATLTDSAGNSTSVTHAIGVDASALNAPVLTIGTFAGNNIIDGAEVQATQTLSGSSLNVEVGQIVSITLNGKTYTATVQADGSWSTSVPAADLALLTNGSVTITAEVADKAGNPASATHDVTVDLTQSALAIAPITGDNQLNAIEAAAGISISGSSTNVAAGASITIALNGKFYEAIVQADGSWTTTVPSADLTILGDGNLTVTVSATDEAGNLVTGSQQLGVLINSLPVATLNTPFGDGYLNKAESTSDQTLSGTTGVSGSGQTVSVVLGGKTYTGIVDNNGNWSVSVPSADLVALPDGPTSIGVTVGDVAGNTSSITSSATVDLTVPVLTINTISGDDIINIAESQQALQITGTAPINDSGQPVVVKVTINGLTYNGLVLADGSWSVTIPAGDLANLPNGASSITATLTDAAGNTGSVSHGITLDTDPAQAPLLTINTLSGDDYLSLAESNLPLTISGGSQRVEQGQQVTVTLNGKTYTAVVGADGSWSLQVPAVDVGALPDGKDTLTATVSDTSGNQATANHNLTVITDAGNLPQLSVNVIAGDDIINANEANAAIIISGGSSHVQPGQVVSVLLNGKTYTAVVQADGSWSATVPSADVQALPQGPQTVTASVTDIAENPASATHNVTVDTVPPLLEIDIFAGDGILNLAEALLGQVLSGHTDPGLTVTVTLGANVYTALADPTTGAWSVNIPSNILQGLLDGNVTIGVSVTDAAGNGVSDSITVAVNTHTLPSLTLNPLFGDNILNIAELGIATPIGGAAANLLVNTPVLVQIGTYVVNGIVNNDGTWSALIPANALALLADGTVQVVVSAVDAAGNPASAGGSLEILSHLLPNPTINLPFGDGALNLVEAGVNQLLTGTTGIIGNGQTVVVSLNGKDYNATVGNNGQWSVTLPTADLLGLVDGEHTISVVATDKGGNSHGVTLDFDSILTGLPVAELDTPFIDGIVNHAEALLGGALTGTTGIASNLGQTVKVNVNGLTLNATVNADGSWTLPLDSATLLGLPDGTWPITVTVTDSVGNTSSTNGSVDILVNKLPLPTLDLPFGDGLLNIAEAALTQTLTGKTGLIGSGQIVTVTVDEGLPNQQTFTAQADGLGGWSLQLTAAQLAVFTNGQHTVEVTVEDRGGNTATTAPLDVNALLTLPTPTIVPPFGVDGVLSISEAAGALTITGTTGVNGAGQAVKVVIDVNGVSYNAQVDINGNWSLPLPAATLSTLLDGPHVLTVTATDAAGNTNSSALNFTSDLTAPVPTINTPFGDGFLNLAETNLGQTLTGNSGDATAVTVKIGNINFAAQVNGDGTWSLALNSGALRDLVEGDNTITVTATDAAGNQGTAGSSVHVSITTLPTVTISNFTADNTINYAESQSVQLISGTSTNVAVGQQVTVTLNSKTYTGVVLANGSWSVSVPPADLKALSGTPSITAQVSDQAGNLAVDNHSFNVNLTPPGQIITVDPITGDNIVNASEVGLIINLTGKVVGGIGLGQVVTITVGGLPLGIPVTTLADGTFSTVVTFPIDGNIVVTASTTLLTPLPTVFTASETVLVDRIPPTLTINTFAGNDVLNASESTVAQAISGTASVSEAGRIVTVTLNGKTYSAQVSGTGTWSVNVPPADLVNLPQGSSTINATLSDAAGNTTPATHVITTDTTAPLLSVDLLAGDNILTLAEALLGQALTGTGGIGETVTITLGPLTASVVVGPDGKWSIPLPSLNLQSLTDGPQIIGVTLTDTAGNSSHTDVTLNVALNKTLGAGVNALFGGDGVLNLAESLLTQVISGNATGDYNGAVVHVTIAGITLDAVVGGNGQWSVSLLPSQLNLLGDGLAQVNVQIVDSHGNVVNDLIDIDVLTQNLPVIGPVTAFGDGLLNAVEAGVSQTVSGVINGLGIGGGSVSVSLGTKTYTASVGSDGTWSLAIPPLDLAALSDGNLALGVSVTDSAGNVVSKNIDITAIIHNLPNIVLDPIFGDGILNVADLLLNQTIGGTVTNLAKGATINLDIAGSQTLTAIVGDGGKWSATVTPDILGILQGLGNGNFTVTASATDAVGNTTSATAGLQLDVKLPVITLDPLFGGDGFLNAAEALVAQTVSGTVAFASAGAQVQVSLGGKNFLTTVGGDGKFSLVLQPADLHTLLDGNINVGVSVLDGSGNTGVLNTAIDVIVNKLPTLALNPLFGGDGFLNAAEALLTQTISGTTTNAAAGSQVVIKVGTLQLNAVVDADGGWSATINPLQLADLAAGNLIVSATVTDPAGNTSGASLGLNVATILPTLTLNPLFGNGTLDLSDLLSPQILSGNAGNVSAGTTITLTLGSHTYTTSVDATGKWQLPIPTLDLQGLLDGVTNVTASLTDAAGNTVSQASPLNVLINALPTLTLDPLFGGDGLLNALEATGNQIISGHATNAPGSTIQVNLGSNTFTTQVKADGSWSLSLTPLNLSSLLDGNLSLGVSVTNSAGKTGSISADLGVGIHNLPTVNLGSLFGDGFLNLSEANLNQLIGGTTTNAIGGSVSVNVGGLVLTAAVGNDGKWSVSVPTLNLVNLADGPLSVGVTVTDRYGNTSSANASATVKTHALPLLGIDALGTLTGALGILTNGLSISGTSLNVQQGAKVSVTLLGSTLQGTVDATGHWTVKFDTTNALKGLNVLNLIPTLLGTVVAASVTDLAGNGVSVSAGLTSGIELPLLLTANAAVETLSLDTSGSENTGTDSTTDNTAVQHAQVAAVQHSTTETSTPTSEVSTTQTTTDTSEPVTSTLVVNPTLPVDTAGVTTVEDTTFSIGGVTINLADGTTASGDTIHGSSGNDVIHVNALDFLSIDGGAGIDTLELDGKNLNLDLTALGLKVQHIDIFDLGTSGTNSITLDLHEALNVKDAASDNLLIKGSVGDQVNLTQAEGGTWSSVGQRTVDGQVFDVYHNSALESGNTLGDVLVQQGLHVNLV
ncbi:Antitoxin of toxin-antitoxin stability system [Serratia fonticola]|uniref:Ig-like domain-containing protein n=2 Tax=Serratia fonticola TaxID=47917 RepID=UPI0021789800|nr:Ig-like domain-containing protein [Serratia fonticola]CAI0737340.1 Antitoxin of toxin-antitoxin stability system [Serratia fonticola]